MPDLLAGTKVTALDTPPTVSDTEDGSFTFNATTFGIDADSGTYNDCGVAFMAPTTGRVEISWEAWLSNSGSSFVLVSPVVRVGSTVGSGAVVLAADDDNSVAAGQNAHRGSADYHLTGLTPGDVYNVRLEHRVAANTGTIQRRHVIVKPTT